MEASTKFSIALYHLKTTISGRTKQFFIDGFRYFYGKATMFIVNYSTPQLLVLMEISYDESQVGSFVYISKRFISSEVESFDGELHFNYNKVNDRVLVSCSGVNVVVSTWSLRHNRVAQRSIENWCRRDGEMCGLLNRRSRCWIEDFDYWIEETDVNVF